MAEKVRIFSLAKELGMDSKVLIEHCRAAGLSVKTSALASITPDEKQLVLDHIASSGGGGGGGSEEPDAELAPTREHVPGLSSRMREMRTMAPKERPRTADPEPAIEEPAVEVESTDAEAPVAAEAEASPEAVEEVAATAEDASEAGSDYSSTEGEIDAVTRDDYQPQHGGGAPREMRPVGTPTHSDLPVRSEKPDRSRSRPSLPGLAAIPAFKPQESKKKADNEPKAQKPEIRLAPDEYDAASPLAQRLKQAQAAEDKSRRSKGGAKSKDGSFVDDEEKSRRSTGMGSMDSTRSARRQKRQHGQA